jgi:hypothetical protein
LDIDNERRADCREQSGLGIFELALSLRKGNQITYEDEGGIQVFVVFPRVLSVKVLRLLAIYGEKVGA